MLFATRLKPVVDVVGPRFHEAAAAWDRHDVKGTLSAIPHPRDAATADEAVFCIDAASLDPRRAGWLRACAFAASRFKDDDRCVIAGFLGGRHRGRRRSSLDAAVSFADRDRGDRARAVAGLLLAENGRWSAAAVHLDAVGSDDVWARYMALRARLVCRADVGADVDALVARAPDFVEAVLLGVGACFSAGRRDDGLARLDAAAARFPRDPRVLAMRAGHNLTNGDFVGAVACATAAADTGGPAWSRVLRGMLAFARLCAGRDEDRAALAVDDGGLPASLRARLSSAAGKRVFLPATGAVQERWQCFPTVTAMAAALQGHPLDVKALGRGASAGRGTTTGRLADVLEPQGFRVLHIHATWDAATALLDQGVPLIGELVGRGPGHVELLHGYDARLRFLWSRDPAEPASTFVDADHLAGRYAPAGSSLIAFVAPGRAVVVDERHLHPQGAALLALSRAVDKGDVDAAVAAAARVGDDGVTGLLRDLLGAGVTVTSAAIEERLEQSIADAPGAWMARAADVVAGRRGAAAAAAALKSREDVPWFLVRELLARARLDDGDVDGADTAIGRLLERAPGAAELWFVERSIAIAVDDDARVAAADAVLRDLQERNEKPTTSMVERLRRLDAQRVNEGDHGGLQVERVATMFRAEPDGFVLLRALEDLVRVRPRDADVWGLLHKYYTDQSRDDLADVVKGRARDAGVDLDDAGDDDDNVSRAFAACASQRFDDAKVIIDALPKRLPWMSEARRRALVIFYRAGADPTSTTLVQEIDDEFGADAPVPPRLRTGFWALAFEHVGVEQLPRRAQRALDELLVRLDLPATPRLESLRARFDRVAGRLRAAEERLQRQQFPTRPEQARLRLSRGDNKGAGVLVDDVLRDAPGDLDALAMAARLPKGDGKAWQRRAPFDVDPAALSLPESGVPTDAQLQQAFPPTRFPEVVRGVFAANALARDGEPLRALLRLRAVEKVRGPEAIEGWRAELHAAVAADVGLEEEARAVAEASVARWPHHPAHAALLARRRAFVDVDDGGAAALAALARFGPDGRNLSTALNGVDGPEGLRKRFDRLPPAQRRGAALMLATMAAGHPAVAPLVDEVAKAYPTSMAVLAAQVRADLARGDRASAVARAERLLVSCAREPVVLRSAAAGLGRADVVLAARLFEAAAGASGDDGDRVAAAGVLVGVDDARARALVDAVRAVDADREDAAALAVFLGSDDRGAVAVVDRADVGGAWVAVARVVVAERRRKPVADGWVDGAVARYDDLGNDDVERGLLAGALRAWCLHHDRPDQLGRFPGGDDRWPKSKAWLPPAQRPEPKNLQRSTSTTPAPSSSSLDQLPPGVWIAIALGASALIKGLIAWLGHH